MNNHYTSPSSEFEWVDYYGKQLAKLFRDYSVPEDIDRKLRMELGETLISKLLKHCVLEREVETLLNNRYNLTLNYDQKNVLQQMVWRIKGKNLRYQK